ncbi:MAG: hypothetical protein ONB41_08160 [candidate division KSB1 bacterium]|nr:hypothetical protein [candidate division KSB1 bacterium]
MFLWLILLNGVVAAQRMVLKDAATPIAEKPSPQSRIIAVLAKGDSVRILKRSDAWLHVAFRRKKKGWMFVGRSAVLNNMPAATPNTSAQPTNAAAVDKVKPLEQMPPSNPPATDGGLSFHLGTFSRQFTYVGKFYYRTRPALDVEGTFQYVAGNIASFYLMHGNAKYVRPIGRSFDGTLTAGAGVINTVPVRAAGGKSVSNMAINYGLGVQRHLNNRNWLRLDLRGYTALRNKQGLANFFEFTVGVAIGISWAKI